MNPGHNLNRRLNPLNHQLDLQLVRDVPITPAQAFEGWTVPETLMQWFCPRPWKVVACDIDLQCGGVFATVMQSPEGHTLPRSEGTFLVVDAPHRLVWTNILGPGYRPNPPAPGDFGFVCELCFDAMQGGGTRYQATVRHVDEAGKLAHEKMGFEPGWSAALAQLVELMQARQG